mmetsp:Transcript_22839/g.53946  ORF Transcript_22839/g.53946 Transcript_22839/m.53946 type:complete len:209 (-) Transcript_22839:264-890(-)
MGRFWIADCIRVRSICSVCCCCEGLGDCRCLPGSNPVSATTRFDRPVGSFEGGNPCLADVGTILARWKKDCPFCKASEKDGDISTPRDCDGLPPPVSPPLPLPLPLPLARLFATFRLLPMRFRVCIRGDRLPVKLPRRSSCKSALGLAGAARGRWEPLWRRRLWAKRPRSPFPLPFPLPSPPMLVFKRASSSLSDCSSSTRCIMGPPP